MKKILIIAAAMLASATPALAEGEKGEGRIEARGGIAFAGGAEEAVAGVAAGYDFNLGEGQAFAGFEVSADKLLVGGADVLFGVTGRLGARVGENGRLFGTAGYSFNEGDAFHAGAGYQHNLGEKAYAKVEYRRYFNSGTDINTATVGVGIRF